MSLNGTVERWEYKLVSMGNPLEPDIELRANAIGKQGWELSAIDSGVWVFKRPLVAEQPGQLEAIIEETMPLSQALPAVQSSPAAQHQRVL